MKEKYYLFIDECGDQSLSSVDENFPIFTLCGVIVSESMLSDLTSMVNEMKMKYWGNTSTIFHSRDIRRCQGGFEMLFNLDTKKEFYIDLNDIMSNGRYNVISCSIMKNDYIKKYGKLQDIYAVSLSFIMERAIFFLDTLDKDISLDVIVEKRGKKEDANLSNSYNRVLQKGTYYVNPDRMRKYFNKFTLRSKKENDIGLQVSDLIAYPITRHILNEEESNPAFDIIKGKIYQANGTLYGLKKFP